MLHRYFNAYGLMGVLMLLGHEYIGSLHVQICSRQPQPALWKRTEPQ